LPISEIRKARNIAGLKIFLKKIRSNTLSLASIILIPMEKLKNGMIHAKLIGLGSRILTIS